MAPAVQVAGPLLLVVYWLLYCLIPRNSGLINREILQASQQLVNQKNQSSVVLTQYS